MGLDKIGLDVSDYDSLDGDLELAESNSQIRLRNLGKDVLSAGKSIIFLCSYNTDRNPDYTTSSTGTVALIDGSGGVVSGGFYDTKATESSSYTMPDGFKFGDCTITAKISPNWTDVPASIETILQLAGLAGGANTLNCYVKTDGGMAIQLWNATSGFVANYTITKEQINGAGLSWDQNEPVYIAITISTANNEIQVYAGRVSDVTTNIKSGDSDITGVLTDAGSCLLAVGARAAMGHPGDIDVYEVVIYDGIISTAASFAIPAEIKKVFATESSPVVVFNEIDLESSRAVDMSAINIIELVTVGTIHDYQYSCHDISGLPFWSAEMDLTALQSESDPTGKYFQLRAILDADTGVERAGLADTGNFLTVGDAPAPPPPDEPASPAWTDNEDGETGEYAATIDDDATKTTIEYRREGTTTYSSVTTTDTGAMTKTITGLSVGYYEIRSYSETSGVFSTPSDMIRCQVTDTALAASTNQILIDFGEEISFCPKIGSERRIWAVVDRNPPQQIKNQAGVTSSVSIKHIEIQVDNDSTTGIATDEVNCGLDMVKVDERRGKTPKKYRIVEPLVQDGDGNMVYYMVE